MASFDLTVNKWGNFKIYGCTLFKKNGHFWFSFPNFKLERENEKPSYLSHCRFEDKETHDLFSEKLMPLLQTELRNAKMDDGNMSDAHMSDANENEEIPF